MARERLQAEAESFVAVSYHVHRDVQQRDPPPDTYFTMLVAVIGACGKTTVT